MYHRNLPFRVAWAACASALSAVLVTFPVGAQPVTVYGGPTYDSTTSTGYLAPALPTAPGTSAGHGVAVGSAIKYIGGNYLDRRAVRWNATGGAATELGDLGTGNNGVTFSTAYAVNAAGTAVGRANKYIAGADRGQRAVRWGAGGTAATELGNLGTWSNGFADCVAIAVNDTDTVVGRALKFTGNASVGDRAVRWEAGGTAATELGNLGTDGNGITYCCAVSVNAAGAAVGYARKFVGGTSLSDRAVRWDAGGSAATELGNLGTDSSGVTYSSAYAINAAGTAVGFAHKYISGTHVGTRAVRWHAGGSAATELGNLGTDTYGITYSNAISVNVVGTAVGFARKYSGDRSLGDRAVRWDAGGTAGTELGNLGTDSDGYALSNATAVNATGTAVGYAQKYAGGLLRGNRAVVWSMDGVAIDLNTLLSPSDAALWTLTEACGISDTNWVTGIGSFDPEGSGAAPAYDRLFLLHLCSASGPRPAIIQHPVSLARNAGSVAVLTVTAWGETVLNYQWRRFGGALSNGPTTTGSNIAGATTNQLTISNVGPGDAAGYDVVVSNACGSDTSRGAFLTIIPSCATQQPIPMLLAANKNSDDVAAVSAVTGLSIRPVAEAAGKLDYANGLAVDLAGKAFVSSAANGRVQRFDLRQRELELQFSGGGLSGPVDVLLRPSTLLVSSYGTNQIKEYNLDTGLWIRNLVAAGSGGLSGPTGLFARPNGNLLVCSENSGQVLEYDANGAFVRVAASGGGLSVPADVLLDAAGNLLVASFATDSVKKFDPNGVYVGDFVAGGSGGLDGAGGLCWSPGGNLWVASRFTSQIIEYDGQTGAFVRVFSSGSHLSQPTYLAVAYLCDPDCNGNGVLDQWDIELQRSGDCDHDGTPDECQNIVPSGTAAALDGVDDHLTAGVRPGLNLLNNFTIEAWVRPTATGGVQRFVSDGFFSSSDPNETTGYGFGMLNGKPVFTTYGVKDYIPTIATLPTGNWSHVAISMSSGNDVKFYINGNLAAFELGLLPARSSPHAFNIGRNPSSDPNRWQPFGGVIDEVRVWSTVRTDQQIFDHFAVPLVGNEPNLVAYWQFDEGTGPTAFDLAGANDATLVGATWVVSSCARVPCSADADQDGDVDQDDLDLVLFFFAQSVPPGTNGDLTGDGVVTQDDLDLVLFEFGLLCL